MNEYFYLDKNNQQQGPISPQQFYAYDVTAETLVWCSGMDNWTRAGNNFRILLVHEVLTRLHLPHPIPTMRNNPIKAAPCNHVPTHTWCGQFSLQFVVVFL